MKNLNFKYISAQNFLCFGPQGIELKFEDYSKVVFIQGLNKDAKVNDGSLDDQNKTSSNGSGKSSIQEIIVYGLFGKTVKKHTALKKDGVIHNLVGKNCKIEVIWDKYRVVRTRSKNALRVWESEDHTWNDSTEITTGSMDETQVLIEEKLGLNYETFLSICIFSDDQSNSFLESEAAVKRQIIENLLSLGIYRKWQEKASENLKLKKNNLTLLSKEYDLIDSQFKSLQTKQNQLVLKNDTWIKNTTNEAEQLSEKIKNLQSELDNSDYTEQIDAYKKAQNRITDISLDLENKKSNLEKFENKKQLLDTKKQELVTVIYNLRTKISDIKTDCKSLKNKLDELQIHIDSLSSKKDLKLCSFCHGEIDPKNIDGVIEQEKNKMESIKDNIRQKISELNPLEVTLQEKNQNYQKLQEIESDCNSKAKDLQSCIDSLTKELLEKNKVKEPQPEAKTIELQEKIKQTQEAIDGKILDLQNNNPYTDMIKNGLDELENYQLKINQKKNEIELIESDIPYYQFWSQGFGDKGIRKIVVDGVIPQLNNRISFWLQYLNDNTINLKFDSEFNEIIERNPPDGTPYIYYAMSAGQRRRLNLAVSQAFADVMGLTAGCTPSIMFLDEVTTNIDPLGVQGIYNIIHALSEEKQIFITSHDHDLIKMLESCDVMQLVHEKGFTVLKKD